MTERDRREKAPATAPPLETDEERCRRLGREGRELVLEITGGDPMPGAPEELRRAFLEAQEEAP